jgi:DNA-binding response OmpR family regulator
MGCDSTHDFIRMLHRISPNVVVVRHKLDVGYSDDVIAAIATVGMSPAAKVIVLATAGLTASVEARQVIIGADCVLRDPVRTDVLLAYVAKYLRPAPSSAVGCARQGVEMISFSGATLNVLERTLRHGGRTVSLTPREVTLIELLTASAGNIVTYDTLYSEILDRQFCGDTSNMRVLLQKLNSSADSVGIALREWVDVIPKTGYRYKLTATERLRPSTLTRSIRSPLALRKNNGT